MIVTNDAALTSSQVAKRTPETWLDPIWAQTNSWQAIWVFTDSKLVQKQQRYSLLCVKAQSTQSYIDCHLISTFYCCPWSLRGHLRHFLILFGLVMMVLVRRSLSLNQQVVTAHCSFKIGRFDEDCHFPDPLKIDWVYMAPILVIGILSVLNLTAVCFLACKIATKAPPVL